MYSQNLIKVPSPWLIMVCRCNFNWSRPLLLHSLVVWSYSSCPSFFAFLIIYSHLWSCTHSRYASRRNVNFFNQTIGGIENDDLKTFTRGNLLSIVFSEFLLAYGRRSSTRPTSSEHVPLYDIWLRQKHPFIDKVKCMGMNYEIILLYDSSCPISLRNESFLVS